MPRYSINGHTYESPTELSDDEIDEIGGWDSDITSEEPKERPNLWERANTPFTKVPSSIGKKIGKWIDPEQGTDVWNPRTALGAFAESVGNTVENMFFTPAGAAMSLAFPGASAMSRAAAAPAVKAAAPTIAKYLPSAAQKLHTGARVASAGYGLEGGRTALEGMSEGDIAKTLMGVAQGAGGVWGAKTKFAPYEPPTPPGTYTGTRFPGVPRPQEYQPFPGVPRPSAPPPNVPPPPPPPTEPPPTRFPGRPMTPPPTPPPVPTPSVVNPVTTDIAAEIRRIQEKYRQPTPPVTPEPPPITPEPPVTEPPITPEIPPTEPSPIRYTQPTEGIDPITGKPFRSSSLEGVFPPEEPVGQFGLPDRDLTPAELAAVQERLGPKTPAQQFADQVEPPTQAQQINEAITQTTPESLGPRPVVEDPFTPVPEQPIVEQSVAEPPPVVEPPVTPAPVIPPAITAPRGKGGLRPRQKFETRTFPPGPPKGAAPPAPPVAPPVVPPASPAGKPRLVPKTPPTAPTTPVAPTLEHAIATNGDQLDQLMKDGFKIVSTRTDGAMVMERAAVPEATPAKPQIQQPSLAEQTTAVQDKARADFQAAKRANATKWGASRAKAKELGVDIGKERDIKAVERMIREKDPTWSTPEVAGGEAGPSTASEQMPPKVGPRGGKIKEAPFQPGGVKHGLKVEPTPKPDTGFRRWYNEARGLMSVDFPMMTSAAFRQGLPFIGTKYWREAFAPAAKAYWSKDAYKQVMHSIEMDKLYRPQFDTRVLHPRMELSIAERLGLKFIKAGDVAGAEGVTRGPITSKLGYTAASDRSFAAFTNHLRAWTFKRLLKDAGIWDEASGMIKNEALAREIADFVNTASGRGKLEIGYGFKKGQVYSLEQSAKKLTDTFFSPRLMFSRMKMMNPATYMQASPFVRQQYTNAMIRSIGAWWTIASLAEWAGAKVSKDPNNADYGKIKIGNTRIDPGGGFQQFLVLTHRLMPPGGKHKDQRTGIAAVDLALGLLMAGGGTTTSSVTGNRSSLGVGYKPETRWGILERFMSSKLHPAAKLGYDTLRATEKYPVYMGDRLLQMALPMMVPDVIEALQKDPEMAPLIFMASNLGMGAQTYEGGRVEKPAIVPRSLQKYDWAYKGGGAE